MDFVAPFIILGAILGVVVVGVGVWLIVLVSREGPREATTDPRPQRTASTDVALGFAFFVYIVMMMMLASSGPSDPSHFDPNSSRIVDAIGEIFEVVGVFSTLLLWILLAVLLFGGGINGQMMIVAAALLPLSGVAAIFAGALYARYAGWAIVVPLSLPPLIALYAMWARRPALHAALPAKIVNPAAWGAILILTIAPVPMSAIDEQSYPARQAERQKQRDEDRKERVSPEYAAALERAKQSRARFEALNADSPLVDFIGDLERPSELQRPKSDEDAQGMAHYQQALAKARQVKTRQADAVTLLKGGKILQLGDLAKLDITATPAVCAAYGDALRQVPANGGWEATIDQLSNMKWLIDEGCNLNDALAFVELQFQEFCERYRCRSSNAPDDRRILVLLGRLAALRRPH